MISKLSRVGRPSDGAVLLKLHPNWEKEMEKLVAIAAQVLQFQFTKTTTETPAGVSKLTSTSTLIGKKISEYISRDPLPWELEIKLGDQFLEAYKVTGYIDIYFVNRPIDPKTRSRGHYLVSVTNKWATALDNIPDALVEISIVGTEYNRPVDITSNYQKFCERSVPIIKGHYDSLDIDKPYVRAINKLQQTGWTINKRVLEALLANRDMFINDEPYEDNDSKEKKRISKSVEWSFITKKAEYLKDAKVFYQYLEADYRGRLYYTEPFLTFQGSDLARGIMRFEHGKPMTDEGLQWLAIHTASSFNMSYKIDEIPEWCSADYKTYLKSESLDNISVDKMVLEDRIEWCNQYMDTLVEAGKNAEFSEDAEKPVSFLAACVEWYDYHKAVTERRIHYTRLPIPIDGSNNGWQHLGAISKDKKTGKLVGLVPVQIQQDFYVQTGKEMIELNTDERIAGILAEMPMKSIRKGISKRGSMTRAYSAGAGKIAENMFFDCESADYHETYGITPKDCGKLAKTLVKAIDIVCPGPLQTMNYLQELAAFQLGRHELEGPGTIDTFKKIRGQHWILNEKFKRAESDDDAEQLTDEEIEEFNKLSLELKKYKYKLVYGNNATYIEWDTPSGFDVKYTNWIMRDDKTRGTIAGKQYNHVAKVETDKPDIRGFMCGISPNFIHSMDASHMALVIDDWNGDFGAVHDSFSTHACDVDNLLALTKSVFIDIYDEDNYFDIIRDKITKSTDDVEQPVLGQLNIKEIEDSDYFFA